MAKDLHVEIVDREVHKHGQVLTVQYYDYKEKAGQKGAGSKKEYALEGSFRLTYGNDQTEEEILASIRSEVQKMVVNVSLPPADMTKHMGKKLEFDALPTHLDVVGG